MIFTVNLGNNMIIISPKDMTTAGKLSTLEILCNDLCQHSLFESSNWHESVLNSREQQCAGAALSFLWTGRRLSNKYAIRLNEHKNIADS